VKHLTGIATVALIAHAGLAWAQPVIVGPGEGPARVERPTREAPGRGADGERGPSQRPDTPGLERRDSQAGQDSQRPQAAEREQRPRERSQDPSTQRAQPQMRDQGPDRSDAQRERPENNRSERAQQQNGRPATPSAETAQPRQPDSQRTAPATAQPAPKQDEQTRPSINAPRPAAAQPTTPAAQPAENRAAAGTQPTPESDSAGQRIADSVRQSVERNEIRPVQNLGVSVSVGAELPSRVQLQPLPREIATLRPQYRDYRFTVSDREIVIVDPRSRRIVEVIDRSGGRSGVDVYAAFERRRDVRRWQRPDTIVFREGVVLPAGAPYYDLPDEIIERHPNWRGYQYVMTESEEVAIIEPRSRRIVEVVDKSATRSASASAPGTASAPPASGGADRHELAKMILADARPGEIQGIDGLKGAVLPTQVALRPLPAEVEQQDQQLRGYQYALIGDDVLIVDPKSREVIDVIE